MAETDVLVAPHRSVMPGVAVAFGLFVGVLSYTASFFAYQPTPMEVLSPTSTYTPDILTQIASAENVFPMIIGLFIVGALLQALRLVELHRRGACHDRCVLTRRRLDTVLVVLGGVLLIPVVQVILSDSSIWTDPTLYLYGGFGAVMVGCSALCLRWTGHYVREGSIV